jgi:lipopolysaccharide export system protein LptA
MSRLFRRLRTPAIVVAIAAAIIAGNYGVRNLAAIDPFAKYQANYLQPLGGGIGSLMKNVDVNGYDEGKLKVSFNAAQVQIRRDQQFFRMTLLRDGKTFSDGKVTTEFVAGIATYEAANNRIEVAGAPKVKNETFEITGLRAVIDQNEKKVLVERGASGTYRGGSFSAQAFTLIYDTEEAIVEGVAWKGPAENWELLEATNQTRRDEVDIRMKEWRHLKNPDRDVYIDAEIVDKTSLLRAKTITWDRTTDIVTAEGNVEYHGPDAIVSAPKVVVYRKERRAVATGAVRFYVKPEKDKRNVTSVAGIPPAQVELPPNLRQNQQQDQQDPRSLDTARKYPIIVTCTKVEYVYAEGMKRAVMTGSPKARQTLPGDAWREVSAPTVIYEEEKEIMTLLSEPGGIDVRMKNSLGDDIVAEILVISSKEGDQWITGKNVSGALKIDENETGRRTGGGGGGG